MEKFPVNVRIKFTVIARQRANYEASFSMLESII